MLEVNVDHRSDLRGAAPVEEVKASALALAIAMRITMGSNHVVELDGDDSELRETRALIWLADAVAVSICPDR